MPDAGRTVQIPDEGIWRIGRGDNPLSYPERGHQLHTIGHPDMPADEWREQVDSMPKWNGMRVSPTWEAAFADRR